MLGPNGSLYPWIAPFVFAALSGTLLATGSYVAGAVFGGLALLIGWLHQVAIRRGEAR